MLKSIKSLAMSPKAKKLFAICMCLCICMMSLSCFASAVDTTTDLTPKAAAESIFQTMYSLITVSTIVEVIGVALAAAIGIFLAWWAIRKVARMVITAFSKGKISV